MNSRFRNWPMWAVVGYLMFGVGIAAFGPFEYIGMQAGLVFAFVLAVAVFFSVGFQLGVRSRPPMRAVWRKSQNPAILLNMFRICLFSSTLLMTALLLESAITGRLTLSFSQSAEAYFSQYTNYTRNSGNYSTRFLITSFGALPVFIAQVLGIFYFGRLNTRARFAVVYLFVVTILVYTFAGGTQKQFGDIIIYLVTVVIASQASTGRLRASTLLKVGFLALAGVYVLLMLLANRYQAIGVSLDTLSFRLHPLIRLSDDSVLEEYLGAQLAFPLLMFSGYLSQGYYGLSLAFEQPFTWTAFAGSSYSISVILNQFLGAQFWVEKSYPYLVGAATGWGQSKWHTVFAWLASDLTFPGVIVFMGFVGFLFGRTWNEILRFRNPFSLMVFAMLSVGLVYAPANNQLMHSPGGLATTFGVLILYVLFHASFNAAPTEIRRRRERIKQ